MSNKDEIDKFIDNSTYIKREPRLISDTEMNDYVEIMFKPKAKQQLLVLKKKWQNEARDEYYKDGYFTGIKDFSGYFMDASLKSQRNLMYPDIAKELIDNYKAPIWNFRNAPVNRIGR